MPGLGIEIELLDDVQQTSPAQNLLRDALQAVLQIIVHVGRNVILWHGRLLDQNQCARLVARRKNPTRAPYRGPYQEQRNQEMQMPAARDAQVMLQTQACQSLLFVVVCHLSHDLTSQRSRKLIGDRNEFPVGVRSRGEHFHVAVGLMQARVSELHDLDAGRSAAATMRSPEGYGRCCCPESTLSSARLLVYAPDKEAVRCVAICWRNAALALSL